MVKMKINILFLLMQNFIALYELLMPKKVLKALVNIVFDRFKKS